MKVNNKSENKTKKGDGDELYNKDGVGIGGDSSNGVCDPQADGEKGDIHTNGRGGDCGAGADNTDDGGATGNSGDGENGGNSGLSAEEKYAELNDKFLRLAAEYDNYRKRTAKEKEQLTSFVVSQTLSKLLPIADSLEAAIAQKDANVEQLAQGVEKVSTLFTDTLKGLGVEEIDTTQGFDPNFHNAIMHVENAELAENSIVEVYQKGYKFQDKVIRVATVSVAN